MRKINLLIILYFFTFFSTASATNKNFDEWLAAFKIKAKNQGISEKTISTVIHSYFYFLNYTFMIIINL